MTPAEEANLKRELADWVMQNKLGRPLLSTEVVHHVNGDTADNRPENLEVLQWGEHTIGHHVGASRSDMTKQTVATFARMRGEISRLRSVNAEMHEFIRRVADGDAGMSAAIDFLARIDGEEEEKR